MEIQKDQLVELCWGSPLRKFRFHKVATCFLDRPTPLWIETAICRYFENLVWIWDSIFYKTLMHHSCCPRTNDHKLVPICHSTKLLGICHRLIEHFLDLKMYSYFKNGIKLKVIIWVPTSTCENLELRNLDDWIGALITNG